jgi:hypothetical protein
VSRLTPKKTEVISDDQIEALPYPDDASVWSVGITLPDGTYVGVACPDEALIPAARAQVRARCAELLNRESLR